MILRVVGDQVGLKLRERAEDVIAGLRRHRRPDRPPRPPPYTPAPPPAAEPAAPPPADAAVTSLGRPAPAATADRDRRAPDLVALGGGQASGAEPAATDAATGLGDHRLRRAVGVAGRRPARGSAPSRARGDPRLRARPSRPEHDPRQDRAAHALAARRPGSTTWSAPVPRPRADLSRIVELAALAARRAPSDARRRDLARARVATRTARRRRTAACSTTPTRSCSSAASTTSSSASAWCRSRRCARATGSASSPTSSSSPTRAASVSARPLVGAIVEFCAERGCVGVDALALPGHRAAKNFFETHGFTARSLVMHRTLVHPPAPGD